MDATTEITSGPRHTPPSPASHVRQVLEEAGKDLDNAELPLGFISNPVRDLIAKPAIGVASGVLPSLAQIVPFGDEVTAFCLSVPFNALRFGYGVIHRGGDDGDDGRGAEEVTERGKPPEVQHWRYMLAERRLAKYVADEIRKNCQVSTSDELAAKFVKELDGSFTYRDVTVSSIDGTRLRAVLLHPLVSGKSSAAKLPAIIFVNSWTFTEHEYIVQAERFAKKGYIVMNYCTRGFGASDGLVDVAGPKDREDMGAILDWLEENTDVDVTNIGIAGISYGGGMSLIGAATQDRIKAAASMAGWADLVASLYGNDTPRRIWGLGLMASGFLGGSLDPSIEEQLVRLFKQEKIDEVREWGEKRSANTFIDGINAKNKAIYMSNSFSDDLFNAGHVLRFFERLTCPKRLDFNQGIHGTPEFAGCIGLPNYTWDNVHKWFDHHLKGIGNDVMDKQVTMELKLEPGREEFSAWPNSRITMEKYFLKPRGLLRDGELSSSPNADDGETTIYSLLQGSLLHSTGIPFISGFAESHLHQAISTVLGRPGGFDRIKVAVYRSFSLETTLKIRGKARLNLLLRSSLSKAQVVAYLYDIDERGLCSLISHGSITKHDLSPGVETPLAVDIQPVAYNVQHGHRLGIAVDTMDPLYEPPTRAVYTLMLCHPTHYQSTLEVQCLS